VTEKFVSVAGAVAEPVTLKVPVGVSLGECVAAAGGVTIDDPNYMTGGVMMGKLEQSLDVPITKTTGAVLVFGDDHPVIRRYKRDWPAMVRIGRSACDQCVFCTELCPRYLLGHPIEPHRAMRSLEFNLVGESNVIGTAYCCECNLCSLYSCPEDLDPKQTCTQNKRRLAAEGAKWENPPFNPRRPEIHLNNRKAPMERLMAKLGLNRFRNVGPMTDPKLRPAQVTLPLRQHIGAPCEPTVQQGQTVAVGDVVAAPPVKDGKAALGAAIHASIAGTVATVGDEAIVIRR
jgi:Na+-translocating ferredoxin:NAD+ oxidoreductase RnfC subunit